MAAQRKKLAVFDVDGTLFRNDMMKEIVNRMIEEQLLPTKAARRLAVSRDAWKQRRGTYEDYDHEFVAVVEDTFVRISVKDFRKIASRVIREVKDYQYVYTRRLLSDLRRKDYTLVAVSGMLHEALIIFNRHLGFDYIYGTELVIKDGKFTAEETGLMPYSDKARIVKYFLDKYPEHTLRGSYGVGDTLTDAGMLEQVDHPIAFNPNRRLLETARRRRWQVVLERKDVIYELSKSGYSVDK